MTFRIASLASGSSGNCLYCECGGHALFMDMGISHKAAETALKGLDRTAACAEALFLTHAHRDHTGGLPVFLRKHPEVPVYCSEGCFEDLSRDKMFPQLPKGNFHLFKPGEVLRLWDGAVFSTLPLSHDAEETVGYRCDYSGRSFALVTDLGCANGALAEKLKGLDLLVLEFNHDSRMLELGPYPYPLKRRIAGEKGHLSNEAAAEFLVRLADGRLREVLMAHLSKENNYPLLALETARAELISAGIEPGENLILSAAPASGLSRIMEI